MSDIPRAISVGRRVVVTGMAGAGKSTFSRALSAKTGLPIIVLDVHFWLPGWTKPTEAQWREKQERLLAGDDWIADGNYHATLDLRLERADTVVFLDTRWWTCAWRALVRGIRTRPVDFELPNGCDESRLRRLRDEWCLVWRIWRVRRSERERELKILSQHGKHVAMYVLRSKRAVREFLDVCRPLRPTLLVSSHANTPRPRPRVDSNRITECLNLPPNPGFKIHATRPEGAAHPGGT